MSKEEVTFETNHKPLVTLLGKSTLDILPRGVARFRIRPIPYSFKDELVPRKRIATTNVLSRVL